MTITLLALLASATSPVPSPAPALQEAPPTATAATPEPTAPLAPQATASADADTADDTTWLLPHAALEAELARLAGAHEAATLLRLGTSRGGRSIQALRLAGAGADEDPARPALLVVAGVDGPRVFESGLALDHARRLAEGYGADDAITSLLDTTTVYLVPRANPDPAEWRFAPVLWERAGTGHDMDDDRDGRRGEDPPQDVDGDGLVTWMRVPDPEGTWIEDPNDARALVEADPLKGQRGRWKLYREGRDQDGDERVSEDAQGEGEVNRNFAAGWEEHVPRAGLFPTDEPGTRALCEFVMLHRDIALVLTYGELDNLVAKPKTVGDDARRVKSVPPPGVLESDWKLLGVLAQDYRDLTGRETEGGTDDSGTFQRWAYEHRGLWSLAASPWQLPKGAPPVEEEDSETEAQDATEEGATLEDVTEEALSEEIEEEVAESAPGDDRDEESLQDPSDDAEHLEWIDATGEGARFVPWRTLEHPELGPVEIGGFAPWARSEPPADACAALADAHFAFLLGLGERLPRVTVSEFTFEDLGGGLLRLEAALENESFLPLASASGRRTRTVRPARIRLLLPESAELLAGERQELTGELAGGGGRAEWTWLVRGADARDIALEVDTDHAGKARVEAEVKQ